MFKKYGPKALAAYTYITTHRKQLASAVVVGMGLLDAIQKAH